MECKQYLYKNGNQFLWNSGGWITGAVSKSADIRYAYMGGYGRDPIQSKGYANASVIFNNSSISIICNGSANVAAFEQGIYKKYARGATNATATICTTKGIRDILKYSRLCVTGANGQIATIRNGTANNANTTINTATILKQGTANGLSLNAANTGNYYLVIGNINAYEAFGDTRPDGGTGPTSNPGSVNYNQNCTITEIYLV